MRDDSDFAPLTPTWFPPWFDETFSREVYSPRELPGILELSKSAVYRALKTGDLDAFRVGKRWAVPKPAIREWLLDAYTLNN
ncbi:MULTISPECIES: helix-turn-helix domain-containing protein [Desulfococcus]|uniref:Helix-turn-helix domain-containing protein n=1 Tax=Desulfococcus multivorans DSM 2059 TaxID=1121405 RepID=S7TAG0_DESML|nr:helix-turn-helix domain-containing protein [Desulfococcus multivorans]AOY60105.1 conserved uncharacterized protein [Desulfococcus multivorans]AQV02242.1 DNA-binding protein [Desulfococcus multivorans]EPR34107.1 hypothetical protein dsmv_3448 [Desulfococcus multivorans DSM 2059]SKA27544.1 DNA binding domain-containing protein, excisionase family [Desulfococcus multivorans DSM 2059]